MHVLQPKHSLLSSEDIEKLLTTLNISLTQLPKIGVHDTALPTGAVLGDVIKVERKSEGGKTTIYYRVVAI